MKLLKIIMLKIKETFTKVLDPINIVLKKY